MRQLGRFTLVAALMAVLVPSAWAQRKIDWKERWFWGAHAGAFFHETNVASITVDPIFGGHWLITAKRAGLYISYEQSIFVNRQEALITDPSAFQTGGVRTVTFNDFRRVGVALLGIPTDGKIQPYGGGGISIQQILSPQVEGTFGDVNEQINAQRRADDVASQAFLMFLGGFNYYFGKWAFFGQYQISTESSDFLLAGATHTLQAGIRYSLTGAKEGVSSKF